KTQACRADATFRTVARDHGVDVAITRVDVHRDGDDPTLALENPRHARGPPGKDTVWQVVPLAARKEIRDHLADRRVPRHRVNLQRTWVVPGHKLTMAMATGPGLISRQTI